MVATFLENVAKVKYLGTLTNQNYIHEEIKSRLNSGNACYRAVQNRLSPYLLFRNVKIKIYKIVNYCHLSFCMGVKPDLSRCGKNTD
jgi:hypothetical protein